MEDLHYQIKKNGHVIAAFADKADALQYMSLMRDVSKAAGYKDKYEVEEN